MQIASMSWKNDVLWSSERMLRFWNKNDYIMRFGDNRVVNQFKTKSLVFVFFITTVQPCVESFIGVLATYFNYLLCVLDDRRIYQ